MDSEKRRGILGLWNIIIFGMGGGQFGGVEAGMGARPVYRQYVGYTAITLFQAGC